MYSSANSYKCSIDALLKCIVYELISLGVYIFIEFLLLIMRNTVKILYQISISKILIEFAFFLKISYKVYKISFKFS